MIIPITSTLTMLYGGSREKHWSVAIPDHNIVQPTNYHRAWWRSRQSIWSLDNWRSPPSQNGLWWIFGQGNDYPWQDSMRATVKQANVLRTRPPDLVIHFPHYSIVREVYTCNWYSRGSSSGMYEIMMTFSIEHNTKTKPSIHGTCIAMLLPLNIWWATALSL